jgi:type II secretory pathway component PulL
MTSVADADGRSGNADGRSRTQATAWRRPTWPRLAVIGALLVLAFFVSRSCQQSQIRITKEQAIATAEEQVKFTPENTQIRLLRQGLNSKPFWIVSLSVPTSEGADTFRRLALVRVDANTGKVESVQEGERQQKQR